MSALGEAIPIDRCTDVVIAGAGVVGLAMALELHDRGAEVTVVERGRSLMGASMAAAGMLAVDDPYNPPEIGPLSRLSIARYPLFLNQIAELAEIAVPFQTERTVQYFEGGAKISLAENSLDPRQLGVALLAAVRAASISLLEETEIASVDETEGGVKMRLAGGTSITARAAVYATGCWTTASMLGTDAGAAAIHPRKGQMLRVKLPKSLALSEVHRGEGIYVVPRTRGAQAGTALIGATVEDAGFDTTVRAPDLANLRRLAAELVPALGYEEDAPMVEAWAGLRPATVDSLPVLGACTGEYGRKNTYVASGHYRNGILLAPATAVVMADLIEGKTPAVDLAAFSADRFSTVAAR